MEEREERLVRAFVALTDPSPKGFDSGGLLQDLARHCTQVFHTGGCAVFLTDGDAPPHLMVSTDLRPTTASLLSSLLQADGPVHRCWTTGTPVLLRAAHPPLVQRVPQQRSSSTGAVDPAVNEPLTVALQASGYQALCAVPVRARGREPDGALVLLDTRHGAFPARDIRLAQALAGTAAATLLHHAALDRSTVLAAQLHTALESRVIVEQAKGLLAGHWNTTPQQAFEAIRQHARQHQQALHDVATQVVLHGLLPRPADPGSHHHLSDPTRPTGPADPAG